MVTQPDNVAPKRKQNVKGAQKKGLKKKPGVMNNGTANAEVKGSGKRKEMDEGIIEKSGQKKMKTEKNTVENVSENNLMKGMVTKKSKVNGIASPASKSGGKKQKKKMKGEVNGTSAASKKMEEKENGIASPKTEAINKKQKKKKGKVNKAKEETVQKCKKIWDGLPFEENERMTRYEHLWVKKEAVSKLDELKARLKEQGLGEEEILKKMTRAKRKSHLQLRKELTYEQKKLKQEEEGNGGSRKKVEFINENGKLLKVLRDGRVRAWIELPYAENERMTKYEAMWVKKEVVSKLDELKESLKSQGLKRAEIERQVMRAKRKAHQELHKELMLEQKKLREERSNEAGSQNKENKLSFPEAEFLTDADGLRVKVLKDGTRKALFNLPFEENEHMTKYDTVWVKREMVSKLDELKASLQDQGISEREMIVKMKRAKTKAHKKLKLELILEQNRLKKVQQDSPGSKKTLAAKKRKLKKIQKTGAGEQGSTEKNKVKKMKKGKNDTGKQGVTAAEKKKVKKMKNGLGKQGVTEKMKTMKKGKTVTGKQGD